MATGIANADALFTGAATWATVNAASLLDSEANTVALTTSYVESATFTPGAVTIDGIAIKVAARVASPVGTISVRLAQAGVLVAGTELTLNVSDIDSRAAEQGWYLFKFPGVLLVAATLYTVSCKCSTNAEVTLYRNATAANYSRMLRTTAAVTLAAGDNWHILGEWTAAATKTNRTVTMDQTAATDYGDNTPANPPQFTIGKGGTLICQVTAATTYILRLSGKLWVYTGGTLNMGTVASPMPRNSSARIEFDCTADGDYGLEVYGTFTGQGQSRTIAKIITKAKINVDLAAAGSTVNIDTDTGWLTTDEVAIASTTRTLGQAEQRILNGNAGATSFAITVAATNAHSGTSPTQAEVILLTRNVRIESVSTSFMAYVFAGGAAAVDCDWVAFRYFGTNTTKKRGVEVSTVTGTATFDYCSFRDFDRFGLYITGTTTNNFYARNCVGYKVGAQSGTDAGIGVYTAIVGTAWEVSDCVMIPNNGGGGYGLYFEALGGIVQRIVGTSAQTAGVGVNLGDGRIVGTCSDWTGHACTIGIELTQIHAGTITTLTAWRNNGAAAQAGVVLSTRIGELLLDGVTCFGNGNASMCASATLHMMGPIRVRNAVLSGDTTFATATGFAFSSSVGGQMALPFTFENCTFGVASGIKVNHSTSDIDFTANTPRYVQLIFVNTLLASTTEFANKAQLTGRAYVAYQKQDQTANVHFTDYPALGTVTYETSVFHTDSPSEKLTPSLATPALRLRSQIRRVPVKSGQIMSASAWVRKSSLYTGSAVRLILLSNYAIGVTTDTVIDTMTAAADTWEQLTGAAPAATADGVLEFLLECDGAAGIVYDDDWAFAVA